MASTDAVAAGDFGVGSVVGALGVLVILGIVFLIYEYLLPLCNNPSGLSIPGRRTDNRTEDRPSACTLRANVFWF